MKEEKPGELVEELRNIVRELRLLREVLSPGSVDDIDELGEDEEGVEEDMVPQFPGLVGNDKAPGIKKKAFIVVDSDLDGIFSAAAIGLENDLSGENAKVVFSNPLYIHNFAREAQRSIYDRVFVADIGINNRNPELTWSFFKAVEGKLVKWYDHHRGWKEFIRHKFMELGERDPELLGFVVDETAQSCTELITDNEKLVTLARESDDPVRETMSNLTMILKGASNLAPKDYYTKYEILTFSREYALGNDVHDCRFFRRLNEKSAQYMEIEEETRKMVKEGELRGDVLILNQKNERIDLTMAMFAGYKQAGFVVVGIRRAEGKLCKACGEVNPAVAKDGSCGTCGSKMMGVNYSDTFYIGTKYKELDLSKIFRLNTNYPHRVVVKGMSVDEIVEVLSRVNPAEVKPEKVSKI